MRGLIIQIELAVRRLSATPVFSGAAVVTLALAIGGIAAAFTVADRVLLSPLPFPESDQLVEVGYGVPGYGFDQLPFSVGTFVHTREVQRSLADFAIYYDADRYNVGLQDPERIPVARVTSGFFAVFRSPPALGRTFNEGDEQVGANPVVIVSDDLWRRRWGGDAGLVGRTIHVEGVDREVVGIAQAGFRYPDRLTGLWVPFTIDPSNLMPMSFGYPGVGRVAPGGALDAVRADMQRITGQMSDVFPDRLTPQWAANGGFHSYVRPLREKVVGDVTTEIWLVFGTAAILLLLAAANIVNLFVVRMEGRSREMAVRRALGSGRAKLLALPLTEGLLVGAMGGLVGVGLAAIFLELTVRVAPPDLPRIDEIALTQGTVVFALLVALLAGVVFALLPMLATNNASIQGVLRGGSSSSTGPRGARRLQDLLVANQAALALTLLVAAGLLVQSARNLAATDPGFRTDGALTFEIGLPEEEYQAGTRARVWQDIVDQMEQIAAVETVGAGEFLPFSLDFRKGPLHIEGEDLPEGESGPVVDLKRVTPGYLEAMGMTVLEGRTLERGDGPDGYPAVVANQALVDRHLGGGPALGRRVRITLRGEYVEIVGVVAGARTESFREEPIPFLFFPPGATTPSSPDVPTAMSFVVRTEGPPEELVSALKGAVARIDPKLPLGSVRTLESIVDDHLARQDLIAWVLLAMAATGLVLAAVGVYGVIAYVVVRRRKEVGVRIALGSSPSGILARVVGRALSVVAVGAAAGLVIAFLAGRLVESVLFGVTTSDPLTYGVALALVIGTAVLASLSPAWKAARLDAVTVLRDD